MIKRTSARRDSEITKQGEFTGIPLYRIIRIGIIAMILNQRTDPLILEGDGRFHLQMLVKAEQTAQPPITTFGGLSLYYDILCQGSFFLFLRKGEIREGKEILVKGHIIIDMLNCRDGGQRKSTPAIIHCKSVIECEATIETGVIIINLSRFDIFIRIAPLTEQSGGERILNRNIIAHTPLRFPPRCP